MNLGQASPFRPRKLGAGKGRLTQVAWVWQGRKPKLLESCSPV